MSQKRENSESHDAITERPTKKLRSSSIPEQDSETEDHGLGSLPQGKPQPKVDPVYGQRSAFPGLEDDDELLYGDPSDGIEYLRMVRSEARNVPHLLVAPQSIEPISASHTSAQEGGHENGGYYYDGAYTAGPSTLRQESAPRADSAAQQAYYDSLLLRFAVLRATLKCTPPLSAIESLTSSHPISFPSNSPKAYSEWKNLISQADPQMTQIACMDIDSLFRLLRLLTNLLPAVVRSRSVERIRRSGAWAWASLGKCREVGELGSEEVGELRALGKIAAGALYGFKDRSGIVYGDAESDMGDLTAESEEHQESSSTMGDVNDRVGSSLNDAQDRKLHDQADEADETMSTDGLTLSSAGLALEEAKKRLEEKLGSSQSEEGDGEDGEAFDDSEDEGQGGLDFEERARATLDMILTIIGELYGQRDLLELRDEWAIEADNLRKREIY